MTRPTTPAEAFAEAIALDAPLAARLARYRATMREVSPDVSGAYDRMIARLEAAGAGAQAPAVGDVAPDFAAVDHAGRLLRLSELTARGPLVLSLNRGHWCSYCRMELRHLAALAPEIARRGAALAVITPETRSWAQGLRAEHGFDVPVMTDVDGAAALAWGLLVPMGAEIAGLFAARGVDLPAWQGRGGWMVPIPATYVLAPDRRVLARFVESDFTRRMPAEAILSALARAAEG